MATSSGKNVPGAAQADLGAEGRVGRDVAARDAAVADVADDQDLQSLEHLGPALETGRGEALTQDLADGERVEQTLGRVLVLTVAAVDDA